MIEHIVAFVKTKDNKLAIGANNKLLWHVPEDLQHFKEVSLGKTIYMGSNTFRSILEYNKGKEKILPGRKIIVVSSSLRSSYNLARECGSFKNVKYITIDTLTTLVQDNPNKIYTIVGGSKLYSTFKPDLIHATEVLVESPSHADAFYPVKIEEYARSSSNKVFVSSKGVSYTFYNLLKI